MRQPILPSKALGTALCGALALAGCGSGKTVTATNESVSGVAKKVADSGLRFVPGRWELTRKFIKLDMQGMPPEAEAAMQKAIGKEHTSASCLTKDEAEKPAAKFFGQAAHDCKYDTFSMGSGKIDAKMSCKTAQGAQVVTMTGTYTPETYDMTMSVNGSGPGGKAMSMTMAMSAKHHGECTGKGEGKTAMGG
jgi:Protein of unknown function (DUF3617)